MSVESDLGPAITALLDQIPEVADDRTLTPLHGGTSNRSYLIESRDTKAVLRIPASDDGALGIDRLAEHANTRAAHTVGVGPGVLSPPRADGMLVTAWIEGIAPLADEVDNPAVLDRVATACRALHSAPAFGNEVSFFAVQRRYFTECRSAGYRIPPGYTAYLPWVERLAGALDAGSEGTVPCHNDAVARNLIDNGQRITFIDFEYSGNNDPCAELGVIAGESGLPRESLEHLARRYFGRPRPSRVARATLYRMLTDLTWPLWASIQDSRSELAENYWEWGLERYERATAAFASRGVNGLLDIAASHD